MLDADFFGKAAGLVGLVASCVYILAILGRDWKFKKIPAKRRTHPNRATWFIWALLGIVVVVTYDDSGATDTLWLAKVLALEYCVTAALSIWYGEGGWTRKDLVCLSGAGLSASIWWFLESPEVALFAALVVDLFGAVPTIDKAYRHPESEDRLAWSLTCVSNALNVIALGSWSGVTFAVAMYPVYMLIVNGLITVFLWLPRHAPIRKRGPHRVRPT